jgi:hypothetical protein
MPFNWEGDPKTIRFVSALWIFILFLGLQETLRQCSDHFIYDRYNLKQTIKFKWNYAGWCFGPIHLVG